MFNGKFHYKWSFSIAMLNYQRVESELESVGSSWSRLEHPSPILHPFPESFPPNQGFTGALCTGTSCFRRYWGVSKYCKFRAKKAMPFEMPSWSYRMWDPGYKWYFYDNAKIRSIAKLPRKDPLEIWLVPTISCGVGNYEVATFPIQHQFAGGIPIYMHFIDDLPIPKGGLIGSL